jgi:hypothetical protein
VSGMNCDLWRSRVMELARKRLFDAEERNVVAAHVRVCPDCSLFLEEQTALTSAAKALAARTTMAPPADLEAILLAEFDLARASRRRYLKPAVAAGAIAAALACLAVWHRPPPRTRLEPAAPIKEIAAIPSVPATPALKPVRKSVRRASAPQPADDAGPFVAIPWIVPLDPREPVTVMRVEMPVAALLAVGFTTGAPDPSASAQADVVVGQDGRIHAIRLVSLYSPISNSERSINQ